MSRSRHDTPAPPESWLPFMTGLRAFVAAKVPYQEVDDVTQEVLLRIHRSSSNLRDEERTESWIFTIARRAIADFYRKRRPAQSSFGQSFGEGVHEPVQSSTPSPRGFASFAGDHSVHEEVLSWLRPTVEELPAPYRDALVAADFDGVPQKELAERLGLSLSGAKSRVQRARKLLAEALRRCCQVEMGTDGRVSDFRRKDCDC